MVILMDYNKMAKFILKVISNMLIKVNIFEYNVRHFILLGLGLECTIYVWYQNVIENILFISQILWKSIYQILVKQLIYSII